ncbi:MAG: hypothetical protein ACQR33_05175 [Candidatus Saccharibacteria bacterium]
MFGETFTIHPDDLDNVGQRGKIQGIAAETLRAAGVMMGEDDRLPFDILASMPDIIGADFAKERMIAVIAGLGDLHA